MSARVAIVFGGSRGIGGAIASRLAHQCGLFPIKGTSDADGSFSTISVGVFRRWMQEIARSTAIVPGSERFSERQNSPLKSKAMRI
jgi:hypothetical protein